MKPLRLLLAINELDPGGAEHAFVRLAAALREAGHEIHVVSLRDAGKLAAEIRACRIPVQTLECGRVPGPSALFRFRRMIRSVAPDAVVSFLHQANVLSRLAIRSLGIPHIGSVRVADSRTGVVLTERMTHRWSKRIVAVSPSVARRHATLCGIPDEKMLAIRNGVDVPALHTAAAVHSDEVQTRPGITRRILFAGRLVPQKHPELLIEAFGRLRDEDEASMASTELVMFGDGPLRQSLERLVQHRRLSEHIRLPGRTTALPAWLAASDLCVLCSRYEGLPNVLLEAMALETPVISTDVDGCRDALPDQRFGLLVPPGDAASLASAIKYALKDRAASVERAHRALERIQVEFTWAAFGRCWREAIEAIAGGTASTG